MNHVDEIDYPLKPLEECMRKEMLKKTIDRGNHKSALSEDERPHVTKLMKQDVELGYGIPLTMAYIESPKDAKVYSVGIQNQETINEKGEIIPKKRVTHDLSFNRRKGQSVNQRVREDEMPEVIFGHSMLRYLHLIHHLRWNHPGTQILCNKIDMEKAYWRLHTRPTIAAKCISIWFLDGMWENSYQKSEEQEAILLTRLPFGSSPAPAEFCITSETVFDLKNDLINYNK